jgi:hypothetical protein
MSIPNSSSQPYNPASAIQTLIASAKIGAILLVLFFPFLPRPHVGLGFYIMGHSHKRGIRITGKWIAWF